MFSFCHLDLGDVDMFFFEKTQQITSEMAERIGTHVQFSKNYSFQCLALKKQSFSYSEIVSEPCKSSVTALCTDTTAGQNIQLMPVHYDSILQLSVEKNKKNKK